MEYFGRYNATNHPTTLALLYGDDQELYHMMQLSLLHTFPPSTKTKTFGDTVSKWLTVASFVGLLLSVCSITVRSGHPIARSIRSMSIWQQLRSWLSATNNLFSKWGWKLQLTGDSMKKLEIKTSSNSHPDAKDHALTEAAISPPEEKAPSFSSSQQQDEELGSHTVRNEEPVPELSSSSSSPSEMLSKLKERRKQYLSDSFLDMVDSSPKKSDKDLVSKQARPSVAVQESTSTEATARVPSTRQSNNTPTTTTRTSTKTAKSKLKPWERKKQQRDDLS